VSKAAFPPRSIWVAYHMAVKLSRPPQSWVRHLRRIGFH
jgi:hypothetical protein